MTQWVKLITNYTHEIYHQLPTLTQVAMAYNDLATQFKQKYITQLKLTILN